MFFCFRLLKTFSNNSTSFLTDAGISTSYYEQFFHVTSSIVNTKLTVIEKKPLIKTPVFKFIRCYTYKFIYPELTLCSMEAKRKLKLFWSYLHTHAYGNISTSEIPLRLDATKSLLQSTKASDTPVQGRSIGKAGNFALYDM